MNDIKTPLQESIDKITAYGMELETPADDVMLLKSKVAAYQLCLNRDDEAFVGGHHFENVAALDCFLQKISTTNKSVQLSKTFEMVSGLLYSLFPSAVEGLSIQYNEDALPKLVYSLEAEAWVVNPEMMDSDDGIVSITLEEVTERLHSAVHQNETSRSSKLNSARLISACPETTVFTTSYPLNAQQAETLQTILSAIDRLDLEALFSRLLPSFLEAKRVDYKRSELMNTMRSTELIDLVNEDDDLLEVAISKMEELVKLPTLRTVMSTTFAGVK